MAWGRGLGDQVVADGLKKRFLLLPPKDGSAKCTYGQEPSGSVQDSVTPEGSVGPHDGDQAAEGKLLADLGKQSLNIATMHIPKTRATSCYICPKADTHCTPT